MKRALILLAVVCIVFALVQDTKAQAEFVDLTVIKHITQPFLDALAEKNIPIRTTFQCGTRYRKDWGEGTYMRLTGKAFPWTDGHGGAHLDLFTMKPPMALEGFRPPMTLSTAPLDADGNIVVGDPQYWIRFRIWQTRPCARFSHMLREDPGLAAAWNYWLQGRTDVHKYQDQWHELGLNDDGTVPAIYLSQPYQEIDLGPVNWQGSPYYLNPFEEVVDYEVTEVEWRVDPWKEVFSWAVVLFFGLLVVIGLLRRVRTQDKVWT